MFDLAIKMLDDLVPSIYCDFMKLKNRYLVLNVTI